MKSLRSKFGLGIKETGPRMDTHEGVTYTNTSNKVGNILKEDTAITNALFHPLTEYENCGGTEIQ